MKTRLISLLFIATILVAGCKSGNKETQESAPAPVTETKAPALAFDPATLGEEPVFDIVTSKGTIKVKLYKETPLHRDNFVKLYDLQRVGLHGLRYERLELLLVEEW